MARKDILFGNVNEKYDILIRDGDFVIGESDWQHARHILEADQGQFRQFPLVGVGIRKMINGPFGGTEKRNIKLQLEGDKIAVKRIDFNDSILKIQ